MSRAVTLEEPPGLLAANSLHFGHLSPSRTVSEAEPGVHPSSRRLVAPQVLLDWEVEHLRPADLAEALLRALRSLDARDAALDLRLGEGLARLLGELGIKPLGHSRVEDFAPARLGVSASHVKELRALPRKLGLLPLLRRAFLSGDISRAKLRAVARVATPETEAGWLVRARRFSTRELEKDVSAFRSQQSRGGASEEDLRKEDDPCEGVRVGWACDPVDASLFRHWGKAMVRQIVGHPVSDAQVAEALAAEALTALDSERTADLSDAPRFRGLVRPLASSDPGPSPESERRPRTAGQLVVLGKLARRMVRGEPVDLGLPDVSAPADSWALMEILRDLMSERHGLEAERARLLALASGRAMHRVLGFRTFDDFTQRALGLAPRDVRELIELDSRLMLLPTLREAWLQGCVSRLAASLLSRVATPRTEEPWLEWAGCVSFKRLEIETEWHLTMRASLSLPDYVRLSRGGLPMKDAPTRVLHLEWRQLFERLRERVRAARAEEAADGRGKSEGGACPQAGSLEPKASPDPSADTAAARPPEPEGGACPPAAASSDAADADPVPEPDFTEAWDSCELAALMPLGTVRVSFRCPKEVAELFERAIRCVAAKLGGTADITVADCVRWMLMHFADTHASPEHEARWKAHPILERAGWICSMPHCRECTALQVHHPHQRSQGGPLVPENEDADCEVCHLHVIHAGHATTKGTPPDDLIVGLGASSPGGPREHWRDERLIAQAPRLTPRWRPSC